MKQKIDKILRFGLPKMLYIHLMFRYYNKYGLDIRNPRTFNEKIQFRKIYGNNEFYSKFVDKVKVREYIKKAFGEKYLIPCLGVYDEIDEKVIERLPDSFVIKASHGSGPDYMEIVRDKKTIDSSALCKKMNSALKRKFGKYVHEYFYDINKPVILIEELMVDEKGKIPKDYKIHTFANRGEEKAFIQVDADRFDGHKRNIYNEKWEKQNFTINKKMIDENVEKPHNLEKMVEISKEMLAIFDYVRIDFYECNQKLFIGEITFAHESGYGKFSTSEDDLEFGKLWELDYSNNKLYNRHNPLAKKKYSQN